MSTILYPGENNRSRLLRNVPIRRVNVTNWQSNGLISCWPLINEAGTLNQIAARDVCNRQRHNLTQFARNSVDIVRVGTTFGRLPFFDNDGTNGVPQFWFEGTYPDLLPPFSMACWAYPLVSAQWHTVMMSADGGAAAQYHRIMMDASPQQFRADSRAGGTQAALGGSWVINNWYHIVGVWESTSDRRVYADGVQVGTNTGTTSPTTQNLFGLGGTIDANPDDALNGYLVDCRVYNRALRDAEIAAIPTQWADLYIPPRRSMEMGWSGAAAPAVFGYDLHDDPQPDRRDPVMVPY